MQHFFVLAGTIVTLNKWNRGSWYRIQHPLQHNINKTMIMFFIVGHVEMVTLLPLNLQDSRMNSHSFVIPVGRLWSILQENFLKFLEKNANQTFKVFPKRCYDIPEVLQLVPMKNNGWQKIWQKVSSRWHLLYVSS